MVREDGIRMALSRCPVIRFPSSEERGGIKRFGGRIEKYPKYQFWPEGRIF
jgi:hypothetical protein